MDNIFQDNKYSKLYHCIIQKHGSIEKPKDSYYERHHIIPRSMGGNDSLNNLIYVNSRVHFILHVLIAKAVLPEYRKRAVWCVICFSPKQDKRLIKKKLKSKYIQTLREEHAANLKKLKWYNNGKVSIRLFSEETIPFGFCKGRLKLPSRSGVIFITDGISTKRIKKGQIVPAGWEKGFDLEWKIKRHNAAINHKMGSGKDKIWINNKISNLYILKTEPMPLGYIKGRLKTGNFNPSKMGQKGVGKNNPNYSGISDEIIINHAVKFIEITGDLKITAFMKYCKEHKLPQVYVKSRFTETGGGFIGLKKAALTLYEQSLL